MKRKKTTEVDIGEIIRLLDSGMRRDDVAAQFSDSERNDVEAYLRLLTDIRGIGQTISPDRSRLTETIAKISGEPFNPTVGTALTSFLNRVPAKAFIPVGALAVLVLTVVAIGGPQALDRTEEQGELAAFSRMAPETNAVSLRGGDSTVTFSGTSDTALDIFDEGAIARESGHMDEDMRAAEAFFARDAEVEAALAEF